MTTGKAGIRRYGHSSVLASPRPSLQPCADAIDSSHTMPTSKLGRLACTVVPQCSRTVIATVICRRTSLFLGYLFLDPKDSIDGFAQNVYVVIDQTLLVLCVPRLDQSDECEISVTVSVVALGGEAPFTCSLP
jgi:hypothetical protein